MKYEKNKIINQNIDYLLKRRWNHIEQIVEMDVLFNYMQLLLYKGGEINELCE